MNKNMRKDKHATPYYIDVIFSIWVNEGRFLSHQYLQSYVLFMLHRVLAPFHFQITLMFSFPQETNFHYLKAY